MPFEEAKATKENKAALDAQRWRCNNPRCKMLHTGKDLAAIIARYKRRVCGLWLIPGPVRDEDGRKRGPHGTAYQLIRALMLWYSEPGDTIQFNLKPPGAHSQPGRFEDTEVTPYQYTRVR